jgi:hypothetical protein
MDTSDDDEPFMIDRRHGLNHGNLHMVQKLFNTQNTRLEGNKSELRMNRIISDFLGNPRQIFSLINEDIEELPDIIKTFDTLKTLIVSNCKLKNLKNLPPNIEKLDIRGNCLTFLNSSDIPNKVTEINACKNKITDIDLSQSHNLVDIYISNNPLASDIKFPLGVKTIHAISSNLTNIAPFKHLVCLESLRLNMCNIENIDELPDSITELSISRVILSRSNGVIKNLPKNLKKFIAQSAEIKHFEFDAFPSSLEYLDLYDNNIISLPCVPDNMQLIDIAKNSNLEKIANIPKNINSYDYMHTSKLSFTEEQRKILHKHRHSRNTTIVPNEDNMRHLLGIDNENDGVFDRRIEPKITTIERSHYMSSNQYINTRPDDMIMYERRHRDEIEKMKHIGMTYPITRLDEFRGNPNKNDDDEILNHIRMNMMRQNTQPEIPMHIMHDNFRSTKDKKRRIMHKIIYEI